MLFNRRGHSGLSIRTVCTDRKRSFRSVYERKIVPRYYTVARRYEFYFRVAKQYFTHSLRSFVKYCFCHEKIKFISSSRRVMFFLLYRHADDGVFLWFSEDFRRFSKIVPNTRRTFPNIFREFPKISEDVRRLPRKTRRCFDDTPTNLSTI